MANTIGGINLAVIAQESLKTLLEESLPLAAFSTDFSADVADKGESVTTRVASSVTAGDATSGYTATDVTSTAKTITLGTHEHFTMGFTDLEIAKGGFSMLERTFVRPAVHAVVKSMIEDALDLVTSGNYSSGTDINGTFGADTVADMAKNLTDANVQKNGRSLLCTPAMYGALAKDDAIQAAYAFGGAEAIRENRVPRVHGFDIHEYGAMPSGLPGAALSQEAILIAARQPSMPTGWAGETESLTADNGLTLQYRSWYEGKDGKHYLTCTAIWGVAVGVAGNLHRITDSSSTF